MPDIDLCMSKAHCMLNTNTTIEAISLDFIKTHIFEVSEMNEMNYTVSSKIRKYICHHGVDEVNDTNYLCLSWVDSERESLHSDECSFPG